MKNDNKTKKFGKGKRDFKQNRKYSAKERKENTGKVGEGNVEVRTDTNPINDPKFYYVNDKIGKAVGSIPYNIFPGERIDLKPATGITDNSTKGVPGVAVLRYSSVPGVSRDSASAVNIAARALYSWVRHQNSGHSNYESSDLMLYILALDEIYTRYFEAMRVYQIAMTYDYVNRNIPDLLLNALRVDAGNIRANLAQFRAGLNILAAKISSLAVPQKFHLFKRHAVISSTVFMDGTSKRGQFYVWLQGATHKYNPAHVGGGALEAKQSFPNGNRTYTDLLAEIDDLLQPVLTDDDMNIMSGDILKAYGRENLYTLPFVDEASTANIVYDENMAAQIENACCEGIDTAGISSLDIYQSSNCIMCVPQFNDSNVLHAHIFNSHKDDPDWEDTLEWSRGITFNGECGTEALMKIDEYIRGYDANNQEIINIYTRSSYLDVNHVTFVQYVATLSTFDWHPIVYYVHKTSGVIDEYRGFMGDVKKFTILDGDTIKRLHDSAIMGELNALLLEQNTTL